MMAILNVGTGIILFLSIMILPVILSLVFYETGARLGAGLQLVCILGCIWLAGMTWIIPVIPVIGVIGSMIQMAVMAAININN